MGISHGGFCAPVFKRGGYTLVNEQIAGKENSNHFDAIYYRKYEDFPWLC